MADKAEALGRGLAQGATAGWADEAFAKLLAAVPVEDAPGVPERNYKAGSAEQDYLNATRGADAEAARAFPTNFATGAVLASAPAAIATGGAGGLGAVAGGAGLGALAGAGSSENKGAALAKDAVRGGAVGGIAGAAGNIANAAGPVLAKLWKQGPPPSAPQPAMAMAGARPMQRPQAPMQRPQMNMSESMPSSPPANVPPRRDSLPAMAVPQFPKPGKVPNISDAEMDVAEQRLRQTEASWAKKHDARFNPEAQKIRATGTARPPRRPKGDAPAQTGAIQKLQEQGPPSDPRRVYLSTDEIDPEQLAQGRLASVQGASSSADIGNVYPRRYLLETDWQGQPIDYTNPSDQGFAGGMRGVRRTLQHGDDVQQSPGIARMAPASGPLKDLGFPETLDANINSAEELADTVLGHWQKQLAELRANPQPGPKFSPKRLAAAEADLANPELRQRMIDAYQKEGTRLMRNYAYDNEVLLDGGLNLGPNTRILDKQTGQSLPLAEFMQQSLGNLAKK